MAKKTTPSPAPSPEPLDAIVEPLTQLEMIHALIESFDIDPEEIASLDISVKSGQVRLLGKDRSLRSRKVAT